MTEQVGPIQPASGPELRSKRPQNENNQVHEGDRDTQLLVRQILRLDQTLGSK